MNKVKKYSHKFRPKYRAFYILQKQTKELEEKTTKLWKVVYGLATLKPREEDLFKETEKGDEEEEGQEEKQEEEVEEEEKGIEKIEESKAEEKVEEAKDVELEVVAVKKKTTK